MKILLIGGGGREHALAAALARDPAVTALTVAPGNPGTDGLALTAGGAGRNVAIAATDVDGLARLASDIAADLVVVGPEQPLALGLADRLRSAGIAVFGPDKAAAEIETSKAFAKAFMARHGVPTARHLTTADAGEARAFLDTLAPPYVLKADGLAAGKGVVIADSRIEADVEIDAMLAGKFGAASATLVIEEFLEGEEVSVFALTDGTHSVLLAPAQDHKRLGEGDTGPNTGGMGAYTWTPAAHQGGDVHAFLAMVSERIIAPTVAGLRAEGRLYRGVVYAGLMLTKSGPKVVEFNARFGDPEAQVIVPTLSQPLGAALMACATGTLGEGAASVEHTAFARTVGGRALTVVLAADGYPGAYETGSVIRGVEAAEALPGVQVFQAGTARDADGTLRAVGGRVLNVTGVGASLAQAAARAYAGVAAIDWPQGFHRRDIGWRALSRSDM